MRKECSTVTGLWLTPTRTFTVLFARLHGRTEYRVVARYDSTLFHANFHGFKATPEDERRLSLRRWLSLRTRSAIHDPAFMDAGSSPA